MTIGTSDHAGRVPVFFPRKGLPRFFLLVFLFAGALGIRLDFLGDPPLAFHPTRQYRSALLTRAYYFNSSDSIFEQDKLLAQATKPGVLEPPLMEYMTSWFYRLIGTEALIIPRLLSILFWLAAAVFLYKICMHAVSPDAALASTAFFLFAPYGIYASRSFQPDPLMIMAMLGAIWAILRFRQVGSRRLFVAAVVWSALAIFVKPVCIFPIWLTYLFTSVAEKGFRPILRDTYAAVFLLLSLLPTLLFYGYGLFVAGFLEGQANKSFLPHLLTEGFYWKGWLRLAVGTIGQGALVASLLGLPLVRLRLTRSLLIALWGGYLVFGLVFTYHIHTHDYYHLMLIPIAAIPLGASAAVLLRQLATTSGIWRWAVWGVLVFALLLCVEKARPHLTSSGAESQVPLFEEIGERVGHSTRTILLARYYGKPLQYHGKLAGYSWPRAGDFRLARLRGRPIQRGEELLDSLLLGTPPPEYFIVIEFSEFNDQPDLREALSGFPLLASTGTYLIYDLRRTPAQETPSNLPRPERLSPGDRKAHRRHEPA